MGMQSQQSTAAPPAQTQNYPGYAQATDPRSQMPPTPVTQQQPTSQMPPQGYQGQVSYC